MTGAKRNAPSGPLASSAHSAVTATTGASVRPPRVPASVNQATRARAARSDYVPRVCTAQAAPCPAPVTPTTLSAATQSLEPVPASQAGLATTAMSPALLATTAMAASCLAPVRTAPTATASLGAALVPQASWERSVQFPVQQGPMAPTAHLSAAVTMVAPAPR